MEAAQKETQYCLLVAKMETLGGKGKKPASDNLTRVIVSPKLSGLAQLRICMRAEGAKLEAWSEAQLPMTSKMLPESEWRIKDFR